MNRPEAVLLQELPTIERIIAFVCRRAKLSADDAEEFEAQVKLRLVENDYAILRAYAQRSSLSTYLTSVISRLLNDYRNHRWGRWYASAAATHLGPAAVELERLLYREDRSLEDAIALVRARHPHMTRPQLEVFAEQIPRRQPNRNVEIEENEPLLARETTFAVDHQGTAARISKYVRDFVDALPDNERFILRLRFDGEMPVRHIALALGLEQVVVYRTLYRLFRDIRAKLEAEGFDAAAVAELIGNDAAPLDFHLHDQREPREPIAHSGWRKTHDA